MAGMMKSVKALSVFGFMPRFLEEQAAVKYVESHVWGGSLANKRLTCRALIQ